MLRAQLIHHSQPLLLQQERLRRQLLTLQQKDLRSSQRPICKLLQGRTMHLAALLHASSATAPTQSGEAGYHAQEGQSPS